MTASDSIRDNSLDELRAVVLPLAEVVAARAEALGVTVEVGLAGNDFGVPLWLRADSAGAVVAEARESSGTVRAEWHVAGKPRRRKLGDRHLDMKEAPRHVLIPALDGLEGLLLSMAGECKRRLDATDGAKVKAEELRQKMQLKG